VRFREQDLDKQSDEEICAECAVFVHFAAEVVLLKLLSVIMIDKGYNRD
jgi:hypothetical protein